MTIARHAAKTMHKRSGRRVQRREIREQMAECAVTCKCRGVKK